MSVQDAVRRIHIRDGLRTVLFPYLLWSDGSQLTIGGVRFHRVNISPANVPLHILRSKKGQKLVALLPVADADRR